MVELECMQDLDMPADMSAIIAKLPYKLREQWRSVAESSLY